MNKTIKKQQLIIRELPEKIIETTASVCIIIPHRNRIEQLKTIINKFKSTKIDIYIIDQNNADKFNRGLLLNIGFYIASNATGKVYDRYIFHDVDSYPDQKLKQQYKVDPIKYPIIHYASPHLGYKYKFPHFFGGIVGFNSASFKKINGFPNNIFGWGGEDDMLRQRVLSKNLTIYRPIVGQYELPEHDSPTENDLSFKSNAEKWEKIKKDKETWYKNGVNQISDLFITIVQQENWKEFILNYNVSNINLNFTPLANIKSFPLIASPLNQTVFYYKIDYLAQHITSPTKNTSYLMNRHYVSDERQKRLSKFIGNPVFHNNDKNSPYYNYIEPLLYWDEIQKNIIDTYTEIKLAPKMNNNGGNPINKLIINSFENVYKHNNSLKVSKTDLKNTIKHIFKTYNELLYFRIRNGKITHKYYIFNIGSPQIDWYKDLQWGKRNKYDDDSPYKHIDIVANKIKELQDFVIKSKLPFHMTLAKPYYLRANGCLLGVESTDYIRELNTSYVSEFVEMLEYSCHSMYDCDILINRKDFAYLTQNNTYSYTHLLKNTLIENPPKKWYPLFSQSAIPNYHLDIPVPSADEWTAIKSPVATAPPNWENRQNVGFFRGKSTGCGTTFDNNIRLKFAKISKKWDELKSKKGLIDIGISDLTSRFKAFDQIASFVDKKENAYLLGRKTNYIEQMKYKYIFNIPGNSQAYRFSTEFYKGSLILNVSNNKIPKMWFEPLLINGVNYLHIENVNSIDSQELILYKVIKWLNNNDKTAQEIAMNGLKFAKENINKKTISLFWFFISYHLNRIAS